MNGERMERYKPIIDEELVRLHDAASAYAVAVNKAIGEQFNDNHPYPLAGGALYRVGADTIAFHQALLALCATGWVSCSAPILRTLLDLLLSTAIIVERGDEAELRGFRYTHSFLKATFRSTDANDELHKDCRRQIDAGIAQLSGSNQEKAQRFIFKDRVSSYWYAPDYYRRPQEAADKLLPPDIARYYRALSSAAHGGFFGLGLFRDQPDLIHPNPRNDPRAQSLAVCTSTRLVLETAHARDQFELAAKLSTVYRSLIEQLLKVLSFSEE